MRKDCNNCAHKDKHPHEQPCAMCTAKGDLPPTRWEPGEGYATMTNADRIRAMSDEELAEMLWKTGRNYRAICADPVVDFREHSADMMKWLKQPAKE